MKPKMSAYLQKEVDRILESSHPWEAEITISNLEQTLDEMKREALKEGFYEFY